MITGIYLILFMYAFAPKEKKTKNYLIKDGVSSQSFYLSFSWSCPIFYKVIHVWAVIYIQASFVTCLSWKGKKFHIDMSIHIRWLSTLWWLNIRHMTCLRTSLSMLSRFYHTIWQSFFSIVDNSRHHAKFNKLVQKPIL